jgi:hypothetical protein
MDALLYTYIGCTQQKTMYVLEALKENQNGFELLTILFLILRIFKAFIFLECTQ